MESVYHFQEHDRSLVRTEFDDAWNEFCNHEVFMLPDLEIEFILEALTTLAQTLRRELSYLIHHDVSVRQTFCEEIFLFDNSFISMRPSPLPNCLHFI